MGLIVWTDTLSHNFALPLTVVQGLSNRLIHLSVFEAHAIDLILQFGVITDNFFKFRFQCFNFFLKLCLFLLCECFFVDFRS